MRVVIFAAIACVALLADCTLQAQGTGERVEDASVVYLERSLDWGTWHEPQNRTFRGRLRREIARQAFLVAAREEMGLRTHDAWLGESMPTEGPIEPLDVIGAPGSPSTANRIEIVKGFAPRQEFVAYLRVRGHDVKNTRSAVGDFERLSRDQFPAVLKRMGYKNAALAAKRESDAATPEDVQRLLNEMTFAAQFMAVRRLHALIAKQGDSTDLLVALVRGYCHLGVLTEHLWHPMHQVFKARALIYAQRSVAREPENALAVSARAYALALCGSHHQALQDLARSKRLRGEKDPPAWEPLLAAFVRYDAKRLETDGDLRQLAALLKFLTFESAKSDQQAIETGITALSGPTPKCFRIIDGLCVIGDLGTGHRVTLVGPAVMGESVYADLEKATGVPENVAKVLKDVREGVYDSEHKARQQLVAALKSGRDDGEFTFAVYGAWIAETSLTQSGRRASFLTHHLGVEPDDYLDEITPLVAQHRLAPVLDAMRWSGEKSRAAMSKLKSLPLHEVEVQGRLVGDVLMAVDREGHAAIWKTATEHSDFTTRGLVLLINNHVKEDRGRFAPFLLAASPHSPLAKAILVEQHWDKYKQQAADWEPDAKQHRRLALALGRRYRDAKQDEVAERMFRAAIDVSPDYEVHSALAYMYRQRGDYDKWKATLEEFLKQPESGLDHAKTNNIIAWHHMRRREYEQARPYAARAAESFSGWGLMGAGRCYEGLGRWEQAERYYRALSLRYRESRHTWFLFCKGTGKGDVEAAGEVVDSLLADIKRGDSRQDVHTIIDLLDGREMKVLEYCEKDFKRSPNPFIGMLGAVTADRLGESKRRDALLEAVRVTGGFRTPDGHARNEIRRLAAMLIDDVKQGGKADFDLKELEKFCTAAYELDRFNCAYFVGEYLALHGREDDAKRFWARCAETPETSYCRSIAAFRLVSLGIDPKEFSALVDKENDDAWRTD